MSLGLRGPTMQHVRETILMAGRFAAMAAQPTSSTSVAGHESSSASLKLPSEARTGLKPLGSRLFDQDGLA